MKNHPMEVIKQQSVWSSKITLFSCYDSEHCEFPYYHIRNNVLLKCGKKDDRVSCAHDILVNVSNILHIVKKQICMFAHVPNES